jgi:hypothetical protein
LERIFTGSYSLPPSSRHPILQKLNPEKCVFGVPSGKLLGFMVRHRGIEANPTKVDAIHRMN